MGPVQAAAARQGFSRWDGTRGGAAPTNIVNVFAVLMMTGTLHSWPQCPEGDIRPEAILSRAFGSSRTASHCLEITLYKGSESSDLDFWFDSNIF